MSYDLIVFDWSGVISDDRAPVYESNMRMLQDHNLPRISFDEWRKRATLNAVGIMRQFGVTDSEDAIHAHYYRRFTQVCKEGMRPVMYFDVPETLSYLEKQKKQLRVLSGHPEDHLVRESYGYGIADFFSCIDGNTRDKSNRLRIISRTTDPSRILFVGDTIYDIQQARAAGVNVAAVSTGYHTHERLANASPNHLLRSLSELETIF